MMDENPDNEMLNCTDVSCQSLNYVKAIFKKNKQINNESNLKSKNDGQQQ